MVILITSEVDMAHFNVRLPSVNTVWDPYQVKHPDQLHCPQDNVLVELQTKTMVNAMTATGQQIIFPCLTNAAYTPNIAFGLLLSQ